jgi:uncharacterized protein (TIGR02001 family)
MRNNNSTVRQALRSLVLLAPLLAPAMSHAEDAAAPAGPITVTGSLTAISEYRLRGVSMSDGRPALQGSLTVAHASGLYVGAWASTLDGFGTFGGSDLEFDVSAGYTTAFDGTTVDLGVTGYTFPGTHGHTYEELYASLARSFGPANAKLGVFYAPKRRSIGDADHLYTFGDLAWPLEGTPVTWKAHAGYITGKGSTYTGPRGHIVDYSVGADVAWRALTFNLSWVGTNIRRGEADAYFTVPDGKPGYSLVRGGVVASVTVGF